MTTLPTMFDLGPAAHELKALLGGVSDHQLSASTPCEHYGVGDLLDHLMGLTLAFTAAATKTTDTSDEGSPPSGPPAASAANLDPDWRRRLPVQLDDLVAAWKDPAAWTGLTEAGGVTMPAEVMGVVAVDEVVIHGWDLARATGQPFACDPVSAEAIVGLLSQSTDDDGGGLFGPVVDVPADAPLLDRALGLTGRDPSWTP